MRNSKIFIHFFFLFVALMEFIEINNHRFRTNDFEVYFSTAKDYFSGNNPYIRNYGLDTGLFKYPPTSLQFFGLAIVMKYFFAQVNHILVFAIVTPNFFVTDAECFVLKLTLLFVLLYFLFKTKKIIHWILFLLLVCHFFFEFK